MFPFGFVATVERPGVADKHGNTPPASTHTIQRCARNQLNSIETVDGQLVVFTREQILCDDVDADVKPKDVLVLPGGSRWQVAGEPERMRHPMTGWEPGCVIPVERASS